MVDWRATEERTQGGRAPGTKIGKYEIIERLAIGGQAIVYKCRDSLLDRLVAIKQISSHLAEDPKFLDRFRREAQIMAKLSARQPTIVGLHDVVEDERGLFLVMEYVEGQTIEAVLQQMPGGLEPKAVLQLMWRLAAALHDVHAAGYIHRDIKPANIIVQEGLRPKIMDFGVAASQSGQTSMILGTTKYMAPELFESVAVDGRADIYSLGMVCYEMLLGRARFAEIFEDVVRDSHSERLRWMKWHSNKAVKAPPLNEVNPAIPATLAHIVGKMMAKDPADRYTSMEELGRAIKMAFSAKAKAGRPGRGAAAGAAQADRIDLDDTGIVPAERGPQPPPAPEYQPAPETAPIPKKRLSLTTKLVLLGVIAVSAAATIAVLMVRRAGEEAERARQAQALFDQGYTLYNAQEHEKSLELFKQAFSQYPDTDAGKKSRVVGNMARAWIELKKGNSDESTKYQKVASERLAELERTESSGSDLYKWAREQGITLIRGFGADQQNIRQFQEAYAAAAGMLERNEYDGALSRLSGIQARLLSDEDQRRLAELRAAILREQLREAVGRHLAQADRAFASGQTSLQKGAFAAATGPLSEAEKAYTLARSMLDNDRRDRKVLPMAESDAKLQQVVQRLTQLDRDRPYAAAMARAEQARIEGQRSEELAQLKAARAIQDTQQVANRIRQLELVVEREAALALRDAGKNVEAIQALQALLVKDPSDAVAKAALDDLLNDARWKAMVDAGDQAAGAGNFAAAEQHYLRANDLRSTPELVDKINSVRFEIQWARGLALVAEKKYEDARKAFDLSLQHAPGKAANVESIKGRIDRLQRYDETMEQGRGFLEAGEWLKARDTFNRAAEVLPENKDDVVVWVKTAACRSNIEKAVSARAAGDPVTARAYLKLALTDAQFEADRKKIQELMAQLQGE